MMNDKQSKSQKVFLSVFVAWLYTFYFLHAAKPPDSDSLPALSAESSVGCGAAATAPPPLGPPDPGIKCGGPASPPSAHPHSSKGGRASERGAAGGGDAK